MAAKSDTFWTKHLLRRAGFGGTPDEIEHYTALGYEGALKELLHPETVDNSTLDSLAKQQNFDFTSIDDLKRWWLFRMAFTRRPLEEKMTLFWHGHFATSDKKVRHTYAMYRQNLLFRKHALGNFHELLYEVSRDPAMIIWLDNQQNRKGKPNENYAREIMELFTVGIGNYSENDIKEAARAFTGWQTLPTGFRFNPRQHDDGVKTVLGVSGNLNGEDVIQILVRQKATARFLSKKLIKFFAFEEPSDAMVTRVANAFSKSNFNIRQTVRAVFTDPEFLSEKAYHAKIKSPVELVIGSIKTLQINEINGDIPTMLARMGQDLFMPPNVKGWDGGPAWIATDTMMERFNFAAMITGQKFDEINRYGNSIALVRKYGMRNAGEIVDYFATLLLDKDIPQDAKSKLVNYLSTDMQGNAVATIPDESTLDTKLRGLVRLIMTLPTYQLA